MDRLIFILQTFFYITFFQVLSPQNYFSQNSEWINYTYNENIHSIAGIEDTLWIATSGGLVKYNIQTEEKIFYNVSNSGLISNHISPIAVDSLGNVWMWISYERTLCFPNVSTDYLVKFDGKKWRYFSPNINICDKWDQYPKFMEIDKNNEIWIATSKYGLMNFDGDDWQFFDTTNSNIPSNNIVALSIDQENIKWMGSGEINGLIKFDDNEWTVFDSGNSDIPDYPVFNVEIDNTGKIWLTSYNKIISFENNSWEIYPDIIPEHTYILPGTIKIDNKNQLWLLHDDLYHLSDAGWIIYKLQAQFQTSYNPAIYIDKDNNKWINLNKETPEGHEDYSKAGLAKFNYDKWDTIGLSNSQFRGETVGTIFRDSKNNMWVYGGIMNILQNNVWSYYLLHNDHHRIGYINSVNEDIHGNLWFGSPGDGLIKFDGIHWEIFDTSNSGIPSNRVYDIDFDKDGNLWFITEGEPGVVKFDGINFTICDSTNSGLPSRHIYSIESDSKGNLWFGTGYEGIIKYDYSSWTLYDNQIYGNVITGLFIDDEDCVWIGGFGLTAFKDGIWSYYEHDDSLGYYENLITDITKDNQNNIWVLARYGLYKFDGTSWRKFNHTNAGLPDEFMRAIEFDQFGNLWIGTSSGVILYKEGGVVTKVEGTTINEIIRDFKLAQNYPNPFNPKTTIKYTLPSTIISDAQIEKRNLNNFSPQPSRNVDVNVTLKIYDILGREVATLINEPQKPGFHEIEWNASQHSSGVYFYQLKTANYIETKKMILVR